MTRANKTNTRKALKLPDPLHINDEAPETDGLTEFVPLS
jgi:hypothetical protein